MVKKVRYLTSEAGCVDKKDNDDNDEINLSMSA